MKILLITDIFPPDIGGPATFIDALGNELARRGENVTTICTSRHRNVTVPTDGGPRVIRVYRGSRAWFEIRLRIRLWLEICRADRILINGLESRSTIPLVLSRKYFVVKVVGDTLWERQRLDGSTNLPVIAFQSKKSVSLALKRFKRRLLLNHARHVVCPGEWLADIVRGWSKKSVVQVIPNGVSSQSADLTDEFIPQRALANQRFHAIFVGRLTNWKGVDRAIDAVDRAENWTLDVAGDGPERDILERCVKERDLDRRVNFLGSLDKKALHSQLERSVALLLPSEYEGLSHTLLEAMSCGVVPVASDFGFNREVITNDVNGLLAKFDDADHWADCLRSLEDDEKYARLAEAALLRSCDFDFQQTVEKFVSLLRS